MSKTYELIIKGSSGESEGYESKMPQSTAGDGTDTSSMRDVFKTMSKAWSGAAMVRQVFSWQLSLIGRDTGNSNLQQKIDAGLELGGQALGVAFAFGVGGPVAGAMSLATLGFSYLQKAEQYSYDRRWENIALQEQRRRAGASYNRSRRDT